MKRIGILFSVLLIGSLAFAIAARADFAPGDVFREYKWRPDGKWQRVTGPDATAEGAKKHLPNSVNNINIDDLDGAIKAEAYIEMLLCHGGTIDKKMRVNKNPWITIPESLLIPGQAGQGPPDSEYQYMRYPCVQIPLQQLKAGDNTFEFTCSRGTSLGGAWPQWILYGVTFRVYYDKSKPHPTGKIIVPSAGTSIGESPVLEALSPGHWPGANGPNDIVQVDFIGYYEDFNWEGDGNYHQWHYRYLYNQIKNHIGTATDKPYRVTWDNTWIPAQYQPIKIMARIVDKTGMCYLTEPIENIRLLRSKTVKMYKPYSVPKRWSTRAGNKHECKIDVGDDLDKAIAAKIVMATWNGVAADEIGINGKKVVTKVGLNHDLSYDELEVPLNLIQPGTNTFYTYSTTTHHGIEVQWPGIVLFIMYNERAAVWSFQEIIIDENPPQPARITDCTIVDINGDGRPDLWYAARKGSSNDKDYFMPWYENTGDMKSWKRHLPFAGPSCYGTWGDVDGDADMDLIASKDRKQSLQWMQNPLKEGEAPGKGPWNIYQIYPGEPMEPDEVHASYMGTDNQIHHNLDMNGDGRLDIVVAKYDGPVYYIPTPSNPKTPSGSWAYYKIGESGGTARLADLDNDGDIDVAVRGWWHKNPGDPTKSWETFSYGDFPSAAKVAIGDIDGDGCLDIVLAGEESEEGAAWFRNPGGEAKEQWDKYIVIAPNTGWKGLHSLEVADFDQDGDLDIFTAQMHGRPGQRVAVVENVDGKGRKWQPHVISHTGTHNAKVGDIDGDGDMDIIGKNYEDDKRPRIWINQINKKVSLNKWQDKVIYDWAGKSKCIDL